MQTIWAQIGQPITLPCELHFENITFPSSVQLEWRKNGTLIFNAFGTEIGSSAPEYEGRVARARSLDLTIHSVRSVDQSLFVCSIIRYPAKGTTEMEYGRFVRLVVHSIPRIIEPSNGTKIFAEENGTIRQNCEADGIPTPRIKWTRRMPNDSWVTISDNAQFMVKNLSADDEGEYNCEAENFEGTSHSTITVCMRRPLRIDRDNLSMVDKTALEGASVFWHCALEKLGNNNEVQIKWSKDGRPIAQMEIGLRAHIDRGDFGIMHLRRTDAGEYECTAIRLDTNARGLLESDRAKVRLNVQYKPEISTRTRRFYTVVSGSEAELNCLIDSNPIPTIVKWTKNGREVKAHAEKQLGEANLLQSTVRIVSANLHGDAGIYTCEAENAVGVSESPAEIHVVVAAAPKFTKRPANEYRAKAGEGIQMECEGFAEVPVKRVWTDGEGRPILFPDNRFIIHNVSHSHHGLYRCTLFNSIATVSRDAQLLVDDTVPQCASKFRVECPKSDEFSVHWLPGYPGGNYSQMFRLFYRKIVEMGNAGWNVTEFTDNSNLRLNGLARLGLYELKLEASNRLGEINCTVPGTHHSCTMLKTPQNVCLEYSNFPKERVSLLKWDHVEEAQMYRIKYRKRCTVDGDGGPLDAFQEIVQTPDINYKFSAARFDLSSPNCCFDFVVQSVRVPFTSSPPSSLVTYPSDCSIAYSGSDSTFFMLSSGAFLLILLTFLYCFVFQRCFGKAKIQRNNIFGESAKLCTKSSFGGGAEEQNGGERHGGGADGKAPFGSSFNYSSSRCASTSTATSVHAQCAFGHPIAITRRLFPENYICTKFAEFDEEDEEEWGKNPTAEEGYGQFANSDGAFLMMEASNKRDRSLMNGDGNNNNVAKCCGCSSSVDSKSASYVEMNNAVPRRCIDTAAEEEEERGSAVEGMLRAKYIYEQTEQLNVLEEKRIEQLRRELVENGMI